MQYFNKLHALITTLASASDCVTCDQSELPIDDLTSDAVMQLTHFEN